jgi:uncharacterized alpha-E superfamily protein
VAENVYWLARYLERAENSARLINVNSNLLLDLPPEYRPGWLALIDITGSRELFDKREKRIEERDIVHFLIADLDNPGSILASIRAARENARTLRDVLPNEVWEHLNELFMEIKEELPAALGRRTRFPFLKRIIRAMQTLTGELEGTMSRNDAFTIMLLGRNLERADMTSRIIDVRSGQLLPADAPGFRPFDTIQWLNLLPRSAGVLGALDEACRFLTGVNLATLDQTGLHEFIDRLQLQINVVHQGIAQTYFPPRAGAAAQSQLQFVSAEWQTMPLFSDAALD